MLDNSYIQSPRGQKLGGIKGPGGISPLVPPSFHSIFSLSKYNAFSTAWVTLANSCSLIFDSTHLKRSGFSVIDVLTFLRSISSLPIMQYDGILPKHINISHTMSYNVISKHMNWSGEEWKGTNC